MVFTEATDMVLARGLVGNWLREGLACNCWDGDRVHGHLRRARLEADVPRGMNVTLVGRAGGHHGSIIRAETAAAGDLP